jgi:hypothetical protein
VDMLNLVFEQMVDEKLYEQLVWAHEGSLRPLRLAAGHYQVRVSVVWDAFYASHCLTPGRKTQPTGRNAQPMIPKGGSLFFLA